MEKLWRKEILRREIKVQERWIDLIYSKHAMERLNERSKGSLNLHPTRIKISIDNLSFLNVDNDVITSMGVSVPYRNKEWIIFVINPSGVVSTLNFVNAKKKELRLEKDTTKEKC